MFGEGSLRHNSTHGTQQYVETIGLQDEISTQGTPKKSKDGIDHVLSSNKEVKEPSSCFAADEIVLYSSIHTKHALSTPVEEEGDLTSFFDDDT